MNTESQPDTTKTIHMPSVGGSIRLETERLGIENIKKIFTALITIGMNLKNLIADFSLWELGQFAFELMKMRGLISVAKEALKEFGDLSHEESEALAVHFTDEFDIPNDELEENIELLIELIPASYLHIEKTLDLALAWRKGIKFLKIVKPNE
ncbi:MAG: hypothetical protein ACE5FU_11550 [Nitrospinota bacterium]